MAKKTPFSFNRARELLDDIEGSPGERAPAPAQKRRAKKPVDGADYDGGAKRSAPPLTPVQAVRPGEFVSDEIDKMAPLFVEANPMMACLAKRIDAKSSQATRRCPNCEREVLLVRRRWAAFSAMAWAMVDKTRSENGRGRQPHAAYVSVDGVVSYLICRGCALADHRFANAFRHDELERRKALGEDLSAPERVYKCADCRKDVPRSKAIGYTSGGPVLCSCCYQRRRKQARAN